LTLANPAQALPALATTISGKAIDAWRQLVAGQLPWWLKIAEASEAAAFEPGIGSRAAGGEEVSALSQLCAISAMIRYNRLAVRQADRRWP
jgi:hypothetical protein